MNGLDKRLRTLVGTIPQSYWAEKIPSKPGYWGERILSQLMYARELSKIEGGRHDQLIDQVLGRIEYGLSSEGAITKQSALEAEAILSSMSEEARRYRVLCVAHAHIDMNWMWPWHETVAVTLDTFETMLKLIEEYPEFHFSQSQGAIYRIVERYAPDMLERIRARVQEGRWEVTASHWVEADKNMPSGESLIRQLLYTKRYMAKLFGLTPGRLPLDFEPDTFGHSEHVPEILAAGGIKHYYHCRGSEGPILYRWEAPSGKSVIAYREPTWYNDYVQPVLGSYVPGICSKTGLTTHLYVYGVGDHGGGPTRRDLERLLDMRNWPVYPEIIFGTFEQFFKLAESKADRLPVVRGEMNFVFTGCYSSQTRIKLANRVGETILTEAETFRAVASAAERLPYPAEQLEEAWRHVLFNQFHDILPGSGVIDTREHALGLFQETMALAGTFRKQALERLAWSIDTSAIAVHEDPNGECGIAEGAGVGFGAAHFGVTQVERSGGCVRIAHVFNPSLTEREETVEWVIWDWKSPTRSFIIRDAEQNQVPVQVLDSGFHHYWGHDYMRVLFRARVPALGYSTFTLNETEEPFDPVVYPSDPRIERAPSYVLENDRLLAEFDPLTAAIISLYDKATGEELVDRTRPAGVFRLIHENADGDMTAWYVGAYIHIESLGKGVKWTTAEKGDVRQSLSYMIPFGRSVMKVTVSLDQNSSMLIYDVACDWQEAGKKGDHVPQLNFEWPLAYTCLQYRYDVPFGTVVRGSLGHDVPANSWALAQRRDSGPMIQIIAQGKHGFRGADDALALTLIRSSIDPDRYPEIGDHHKFRIGVAVVGRDVAGDAIALAHRFHYPFSVLPGAVRKGSRPLRDSFAELLEGTVSFSALKAPEEGANGWILRLYETEGQDSKVRIRVALPVRNACFVDALEREATGGCVISVADRIVSFDMQPYSITTIRLTF
ncbi:alpha-mannosidase [Paenibacillus sp. GCM10027626]|uniref:alpha-mannosidase n=1 Tax=Paenibacillus sp. GCM10027626 TaxID=3273411 RepID=UPI00362CF793